MMMGIGTDIIEIKRIEDAITRHGDHFLERIFTQQERDYCFCNRKSSMHFAGRFAAKEAVAKALGTGIGSQVGWHDMEILNDSQGKPEVFFSNTLKQRFPSVQVLLSISHCKDYATATAILITGSNPKSSYSLPTEDLL